MKCYCIIPVIDQLAAEGFGQIFQSEGNRLYCISDPELSQWKADLEKRDVHPDPENERVLYALEFKNGEKGLIIVKYPPNDGF
jgi:hypothetical protein